MSKAHSKKTGFSKSRGISLLQVERVMLRVGHEAVSRRGFDRERLVFDAFSDRGARVPPWFRLIGMGTLEQDLYEGIDYVVQTDVGKIFLQIKSSEYYARRFREKQLARRYNRSIAVAVIGDHVTDFEEVRGVVIASLEKIRNLFVLSRGQEEYLCLS